MENHLAVLEGNCGVIRCRIAECEREILCVFRREGAEFEIIMTDFLQFRHVFRPCGTAERQ